MFLLSLQIVCAKAILTNQNINFFRYVRSLARRGVPPKLIEGKVNMIKDYDNPVQVSFESYKDMVKDVKNSNFGDELEIEKNFLQGDYHGDVFERCDQYYNMHLKDEKYMSSHIKKKIIARKYFNFEKETNLLSHAAKEQIRFLHKTDPLEWNYKALSESFPISEAGVKKLLKCNFVFTDPEKIKAHDENVARKWEILKSGKFSDEIYPLTQKLYKEGKLADDYCNGNPNLPTKVLCSKKVIELKKEEEYGEFSAIVQTYDKHKKQNLLESKESSEKQVSLKEIIINNAKKDGYIKNVRNFKLASEEYDNDGNPEVYPTRRKKIVDNGEIPFSNFKELLKEETERKLNSKYKNEYDEFVEKELSKMKNISSKKTTDSPNYFLKISKYKKENVDLMYEKNNNINTVYKYDDKLGYQHPIGQNIKGKIVSSKLYKKGKLQKIGQCIYDENGEFLYKIFT